MSGWRGERGVVSLPLPLHHRDGGAHARRHPGLCILDARPVPLDKSDSLRLTMPALLSNGTLVAEGGKERGSKLWGHRAFADKYDSELTCSFYNS